MKKSNIYVYFFSLMWYNTNEVRQRMNKYEEKNFEGLDSDLLLSYCGKRMENIGHSYGPHMRDDYLIYYIKKGEAVLSADNRRILLSGEGFFVNFPYSDYVYRSNETRPWSIKWISAKGNLVERYLSLIGVTRENPYIPLKNAQEVESLFDEMYDFFDRPSLAARIHCISLLHKLFSLLALDKTENDREKKGKYVRLAQTMIEERYSDPSLSVSTIASALYLNPNYFSILYKRETGKTPKSVILDVRMRNAEKMLRFTDLSVKEIAAKVGFSDDLHFRRSFDARYGMTPSAYRRSLSFPI